MFKKISGYISAYALWLVVLLLGAWAGYLSQRALLGLAAKYYLSDEFMRQTLIRALDRWYVFVVGLIWLVLMVVTEELFRQSVVKGGLFQRFSFFAGFLLLIIFIFDFILFSLVGWNLDPFRLGILGLELIMCVGLIYFWAKTRKTKA
jgi:hypothetical protein